MRATHHRVSALRLRERSPRRDRSPGRRRRIVPGRRRRPVWNESPMAARRSIQHMVFPPYVLEVHLQRENDVVPLRGTSRWIPLTGRSPPHATSRRFMTRSLASTRHRAESGRRRGRRCDSPVMVIHAAGHSGTVVNEVELASEGYWVEDAGLLRQVGEHGPDPGPELVGGVLDERPRGASVEAAMNAQPLKSGCWYCSRLGIEDGQDLLSWIVEPIDRPGEPAGRAVVLVRPGTRPRAFLAAEEVVERSFRPPRRVSMIRSMPTVWTPSV